MFQKINHSVIQKEKEKKQFKGKYYYYDVSKKSIDN